MTDLRADSMTGEQFVFDERTADPASTEEGERWLRTDLDSGDKIATLRVDVGSSIRDVPIFSTGTAVDTVSEAMRIQVNGLTGYVPIVPVSDAAFPELRMQHNSQVHGFHDRVEPGSAIPDSVVLDYEDGTVSPWTSNYLQITSDSYEGQYAAEISQTLSLSDSSVDKLNLADLNGYDYSQPDSVSFYWKETSNQNGMAVSFFSPSGNELAFASDNPQWVGWDGSYNEFDGGASYGTWIYTEITFNSSDYTITSTAQEDGHKSFFSGSYRFGDTIDTISIGSFNNEPGDSATIDTTYDLWDIYKSQ